MSQKRSQKLIRMVFDLDVFKKKNQLPPARAIQFINVVLLGAFNEKKNIDMKWLIEMKCVYISGMSLSLDRPCDFVRFALHVMLFKCVM